MPGIRYQCDGRINAALLAVGIALAVSGRAAAAPAVAIPFDGPNTHWQLLTSSNQARLLAHECVPGGARNAAGSERMLVAATAGQSALAICPTGRMPVVDEFRARLWVKSSRPGVQLAVRVVLPRSVDAKTRAATTTIVRGPHTQRAGHWQQLELVGLPRLLADHIRVLRAAATSSPIDPREAYVDAVVLAVPGEPQGTEILTDELEVDGVLISQAEAQPPATEPQLDSAGVEARQSTNGPAASGPERVRLQGTSLMVDGKPFALRAIEWNGEPLDFLSARGFNAVQLREPPTAGQLTLAERHGLWLICPPPVEGSAETQNRSAWNRVLAWRLEDLEAHDAPGHFRNWADTTRGRDDLPPRPVVIAPQSEWTALSEVAEIVLTDHPLDGTLPPQEFGEWLAERARLVRPGTPLWVSIGTQFDATATAQAAALAGQDSLTLGVDDDQIEALVRIALMRGCRGVLFRSTSPLDAADSASRRRASLLELINRQLQLVGPWIAAGSVAGQATSSDESTTGAILWVDRARLLVPFQDVPRAASKENNTRQTDTPPSQLAAPCSFTVPGIPDSSQAFLLTPASLRHIALKRVAGGTRIVLESAEGAMVVITQDSQAISGLRQSIVRDGPATLRLARDVAAMRASALAESGRRLAEIGYQTRDADQILAGVTVRLRQADTYLTAGRLDAADALVAMARGHLRQVAERQRQLVNNSPVLSSVPLAVSHDTLVANAQFLRSKELLSSGDNLLYGGDFEDLDELTQFGWQHFNDPIAGIVARAELASAQPYHGRFCLRLSAEPAIPNEAPGPWMVPIRIVSPPIAVEAGQVIEISGWTRVETSARGGTSVLHIEDSLGGPELSLRVPATTGWQPFELIRIANGDELRFAFSLNGPGSAELDALMVRSLRQPVTRRLPLPAMSSTREGAVQR